MAVVQTDAPVAPVYISAAEVAELVGVDATTVYRWASTYPDLPVLRVGGLVRFHRERLLAWLASREQGASRAQRRVRDVQPRAAAAARG